MVVAVSNTIETYEPLRKLRAQLVDLETKRGRIAEESHAATAAATTAKAEADELAVRELMGEATAGDVSKATAEAARAHARAQEKAAALVPYDEAVRRANAMMPRILEEARAWLVEQLMPEALRRIKKLARALVVASAANEELHRFIEDDVRWGDVDVTHIRLQYALPWPLLRLGDPERSGGSRLERWLQEAKDHGLLDEVEGWEPLARR